MKEKHPSAPAEPGDLDDSDDDSILSLEDLHTKYDDIISKLEKLNAEALNMRFDGMIEKLEKLTSEAATSSPTQSNTEATEVLIFITRISGP